MIFYHVTDDIYNITNIFEPRIPDVSYEISENTDIPRVCVAPTISQCITAVPYWGGNKFLEEMTSPLITVCKLIRVYEFDIDVEEELAKGNIIEPFRLKYNDWVYDALITGEHWILKPIKPTKTYIINIESYEEGIEDVYPADIWLRLNKGDECLDINLEEEIESVVTTISVTYKPLLDDEVFISYYREFLIKEDMIDEVKDIISELPDENVYLEEAYFTNNILHVGVSYSCVTYSINNIDKILNYTLSEYLM